MKQIIFSLLKKDKYLKWSTVIAITSTFIIIIFLLITLPLFPNFIPLFYSASWGEPQLIAKEQFFILPVIIFLINICNIILALQLHSSQIFLKRIIYLVSIISSLIMFISAIKIFMIFI